MEHYFKRSQYEDSLVLQNTFSTHKRLKLDQEVEKTLFLNISMMSFRVFISLQHFLCLGNVLEKFRYPQNRITSKTMCLKELRFKQYD